MLSNGRHQLRKNNLFKHLKQRNQDFHPRQTKSEIVQRELMKDTIFTPRLFHPHTDLPRANDCFEPR